MHIYKNDSTRDGIQLLFTSNLAQFSDVFHQAPSGGWEGGAEAISKADALDAQ